MAARMDIAFCVNDRFAEYIGVTIQSICDTQPDSDVVIHVLSDFLTDRRRRRLEEIVMSFSNIRLFFYKVDDLSLRGLKDTWSIYTWYRVLLPDLLPAEVHRVLYLDADTLVTGDLSDLYLMDMKDKAIACVTDIMSFDNDTFDRCRFPKEKGYVCAGVMMMNLDFWRECKLSERIIRFGLQNDARIRFPDQDTINILCQDTKIILPLKFGIQEVFFRDERLHTYHWLEQMSGCVEDPRIVHYAGYAPWFKEFDWTVMHYRWMNCSRKLRHPVMPRYQTRGLNMFKVMVHRLLYPDSGKKLALGEVRDKLNNILYHADS